MDHIKHVTGNPATYQGMFETGKVDLAAVPEPWASILVENGAKVVVSTEEIAYGENLPNVVLVATGELVKKRKKSFKDLLMHNKNQLILSIIIKKKLKILRLRRLKI